MTERKDTNAAWAASWGPHEPPVHYQSEHERQWAERAAALLRRIEWPYGDWVSAEEGVCAICGRMMKDGHADDCELAALLREAPR